MIEEFRRFIRHPSNIPIHFRQGNKQHQLKTTDISQGGLSFTSQQSFSEGQSIVVEIDVCEPAFTAEGIVRWCQREGQRYLIGVAFKDKAVRYAVRMIEQVCHIEAYRQQLEVETGQAISTQQAAFKWIEENAGNFPQPD